MNAKLQGCHVRVTVSREEVSSFARRWPCSGLPDRALWFLLDARNFDLVDLPSCLEGDCEEAASALCSDASDFARDYFADQRGAQ